MHAIIPFFLFQRQIKPLLLQCCCYIASRLAERLTILGFLNAILLQSNGLDSDKASAIHGREGVKAVHGSVLLGIEGAGLARSSENVDVALVHLETDLAIDALLSRDDSLIEPLTLGREVHAAVEALRPFNSHKLISKLTDLGVKDKALEINVSETSNGQAMGIVAATAFESDPSVLDTAFVSLISWCFITMTIRTCQFGQRRDRVQSC